MPESSDNLGSDFCSDDSDCSYEVEEEDAEPALPNPPPVIDPYQGLGSWSIFRRPDLIVKEAFLRHPMRVPMQIAAATEKPLEKVQAVFDELLGGTAWRDDPGFTARDIMRYAEFFNVSCYCYWGGRLISVEQRSNTADTPITFAFWGKHVYLYKGMGPRARDDAQGKTVPSGLAEPDMDLLPETMVRRAQLFEAAKHAPRPVEDFKEFPWSLELADVPPGDYWILCSRDRGDADPDQTSHGLLERFLASHRYPVVRKLPDSEFPTEIIYRKTPAMDNHVEAGECSTISVRIHARDAETTGAWGKRLGIPTTKRSCSRLSELDQVKQSASNTKDCK